jgi:hypothetical protein
VGVAIIAVVVLLQLQQHLHKLPSARRAKVRKLLLIFSGDNLRPALPLTFFARVEAPSSGDPASFCQQFV